MIHLLAWAFGVRITSQWKPTIFALPPATRQEKKPLWDQFDAHPTSEGVRRHRALSALPSPMLKRMTLQDSKFSYLQNSRCSSSKKNVSNSLNQSTAPRGTPRSVKPGSRLWINNVPYPVRNHTIRAFQFSLDRRHQMERAFVGCAMSRLVPGERDFSSQRALVEMTVDPRIEKPCILFIAH